MKKKSLRLTLNSGTEKSQNNLQRLIKITASDILTKQQLVEQLASETGKKAENVRANVNAVLRGKNRKTAYGHKIVKIEANQFKVC